MMNTFLGFVAIVFWSTSIAVARSVTEQLGPMTSASAICLLSGVLGCGYLLLSGWTLQRLLRLPALYLMGCGALFLFYELCLYLSIGLAASRQQVLAVGIINYLWPGLTLLFSLPILGKKASAWLVPGAVLAFAGAFMAMLQRGSSSSASFLAGVREGYVPCLLAFFGAVSWALYSNLSRRWGGDTEGGAVPVFLLASGLVLAALRPAFAEHPHWAARPVAELSFIAIVPALLGYAFWDRAMRRGNVVLIASFSYVTPLLSTVISCLYLSVPAGPGLWAACALVIGGAFICRYSIKDRQA
jgi:drug/metabolite transporter (DMT)-like permease